MQRNLKVQIPKSRISIGFSLGFIKAKPEIRVLAQGLLKKGSQCSKGGEIRTAKEKKPSTV